MYSNDLSKSTSNASIEIFADDTTAFYTGDTVDEVLFNIQKAIIDLNMWAKFNSMTFHPTE